MGFDAAQRITPLEYDFTTLNPVPAGLEYCKGTIPEPTATQLEEFEDGYKSLFDYLAKRASANENEDTASEEAEQSFVSVTEALEAWEARDKDLNLEERAKSNAAVRDMIVAVCSKEITPEQFDAIPARVRSAFIQWLVFELLVGKDQVIDLIGSPEDPTAE